MCRSAEYNYVTLQCRLSDHDRRYVDKDGLNQVSLVEAQGVDYFENLCLTSKAKSVDDVTMGGGCTK